LEAFKEFAEGRQGGQYRLVEIQNARPVSAAVAETTGVEHQSPQVLLLRDGDVVWHTSHYRIRLEALEEAAEG
jgi:bacillithiol system protein YtxJ